MSVFDRAALSHDDRGEIQQDLTARCIDVEEMELVVFDGFSASS